MKRADKSLTQHDLIKVLPAELCNDDQFVKKLNASLKNLQEILRLIAKKAIGRVLTIAEIDSTSGGWISSKKELIKKIEYMTKHDYSGVFSVALKGAFACNIFQKCDNNRYGKRVVEYVMNLYNFKMAPAPSSSRSGDHCFVTYARIIYDKIGQTVLNALRNSGSVFWTTQMKKISNSATKLKTLYWTTHNVHFYRKINVGEHLSLSF